MHNKHKFFILGLFLGFTIPFSEHALVAGFDSSKLFVNFLVFGEKIWQYVFLYVILINSVLLYVKRFRSRINPDSRLVFLLSGITFGFAAVSIIVATMNLF